VSLIVNNEEHLLRALADTGVNSSSILGAYTSAPFIKTDDNNITTWSIMDGIRVGEARNSLKLGNAYLWEKQETP
jgi:hypothetical protein